MTRVLLKFSSHNFITRMGWGPLLLPALFFVLTSPHLLHLELFPPPCFYMAGSWTS